MEARSHVVCSSGWLQTHRVAEGKFESLIFPLPPKGRHDSWTPPGPVPFQNLDIFSQGGASEEPEEGFRKGSLFWYQLLKPSDGIGKQNGAGREVRLPTDALSWRHAEGLSGTPWPFPLRIKGRSTNLSTSAH